eukprot:s244_g10.t1
MASESSEEKVGGLAKFNSDEWRLHPQRDHLPYRRDCRVCVERSTGKPHKRISHPSAYVLSIDTAGPFRHKAMGGYKYLLVACYRFPQLPGVKGEDETSKGDAAEEPVAAPEDGGDWILDEELPAGAGRGDEGEVVEAEPEAKAADVEDLKELAEPLKFSSVYIVRPMKSRKHAETLKAIQEAYIQLRSGDLPVNKLHADRAREYNTKMLEMWAASRDLDVSKTQGDDPPQNGTAERGVRYIKMRMRILLSQANELSGLTDEAVRSLWPYAAETAATQQQAEDLCTDAVKQFISRWAASILKEAEALIKAKALVPLTVEEQRALEMNAFILAPIKEEDDEEEAVYAVYPPKVFQLAEGYLHLKQHRADENIWSVWAVAKDGSMSVRAYINVYVDDILYVGEVAVIHALQTWLTSEWKASDLTWASEESYIRFQAWRLEGPRKEASLHIKGGT